MKKLLEMKKAAEQAKLNKEAAQGDPAASIAPPAQDGPGPSLAIDRAAVAARSPPKGAGKLAQKQPMHDPLAGSPAASSHPPHRCSSISTVLCLDCLPPPIPSLACHCRAHGAPSSEWLNCSVPGVVCARHPVDPRSFFLTASPKGNLPAAPPSTSPH